MVFDACLVYIRLSATQTICHQPTVSPPHTQYLPQLSGGCFAYLSWWFFHQWKVFPSAFVYCNRNSSHLMITFEIAFDGVVWIFVLNFIGCGVYCIWNTECFYVIVTRAAVWKYSFVIFIFIWNHTFYPSTRSFVLWKLEISRNILENQ